ncbi:MAG: hypothetical protein GYB66_02560 [Chloroflexi bacterium]|nr:hypothetical protein [Chloroflexota bacterium]
MSDENSGKYEPLVESENFEVVRVTGPDGEITYHVELFNVTLHFFTEEWEEFVSLITEAGKED